ncbi:hypothetical protein G9F71_017895 [Clostridium sp. FP2]|uniref:hypothetical protein n=1 Tax=Clostridium sp. FP2 TaxID=2724481 RepID=UPI0013E9311F|nr:hypothetical protein [Clostridium sp. FP2]MBZ9624726.1 hypothetical protein [Clostridium sp. FP2]
MNDKINEIASLIMYKGITINCILQDARLNGDNYEINNSDNNTIVTIKSYAPYNLNIIDTYIYDNEENLIKQILYINGKEKTVFDKYQGVLDLINNINASKNIAS